MFLLPFFPFNTTQAIVHFFYSTPFIVYAILQLIDFFNVSEKKFITLKRETYVVFAAGVVIFSIELSSLLGCPDKACIARNTLHTLFGVLILQIGILYLLFQTEMMKNSFHYLRGLAYCLIGVFMLLHEQPSEFRYFVHQAFGYSCIIAGIAANVALVYPPFIPCASTLIIIAQTFFIFGPETVDEFFTAHHMMPHNVLFLAVCIALTIVIATTTGVWYYARYNRIEFPDEPQHNNLPIKLR